jgi:hypothetical protein
VFNALNQSTPKPKNLRTDLLSKEAKNIPATETPNPARNPSFPKATLTKSPNPFNANTATAIHHAHRAPRCKPHAAALVTVPTRIISAPPKRPSPTNAAWAGRFSAHIRSKTVPATSKLAATTTAITVATARKPATTDTAIGRFISPPFATS